MTKNGGLLHHVKHRLYIQSTTKQKVKFKCRYCPYTRHYFRFDIRRRLGIMKWT